MLSVVCLHWHLTAFLQGDEIRQAVFGDEIRQAVFVHQLLSEGEISAETMHLSSQKWSIVENLFARCSSCRSHAVKVDITAFALIYI